MKRNFTYFFLFFVSLVGLFTFTACAQPTPGTPPPQVSDVPSIGDVDHAITQWKNGNNTSYSVTVEENDNTGTFRYRIVIADGKVRAAQQQAKTDGAWQNPTSMDLTLAENYTVDALLDRVRTDVLGVKDKPLNMHAIFDPSLGFPSAVDVTALPTYSAEGNLQLNRDLSYSFTASVKVLIEDTINPTKTPLLSLIRSGGEQAYCDHLRIFDDGSSVYSDDCREILLQLTVSEQQLARITEIAGTIAPLDETREDAGAIYHLMLAGTGTEVGDTTLDAQVWSLAMELGETLSHPIGAGITLLYVRGGRLFGFDMRAAMGQPAAFKATQPLYGTVAKMDGSSLAFADGESLQWLDLQTGDTGVFFANPADGHYVPRGWNHQGQLLLQRFTGDAAPEWGWTTLDDHVWHPISLPAGAYACDTGVSIAPNTAEFVIAVGGDCTQDTGLSLINMNDGSVRKLIDAQKVPGSGAFTPAYSPDGNWITFSLTLMDTPENPQKVFLMRADGSGMIPVTENTTGKAVSPIWLGDSTKIYFAFQGADTGEDGVYAYNVSDGTTDFVFVGSDLSPVGVSPSAEFLVFFSGSDLRSYTLERNELIPIARGDENNIVIFIGWLDTRTDK